MFALSVIPSCHSVPSSLTSQLLLHPCTDLNETWHRCSTTSLDVNVGMWGDNICSTNFEGVMVLDT